MDPQDDAQAAEMIRAYSEEIQRMDERESRARKPLALAYFCLALTGGLALMSSWISISRALSRRMQTMTETVQRWIETGRIS